MSTTSPQYLNRLKSLIKHSGLTVKELAEETDIPLRTLFEYCSGRVPIPRDRLAMLAEALGYTPDDLRYPVPTNTDPQPINQSAPAHEPAQEAVSETIDAHEDDIATSASEDEKPSAEPSHSADGHDMIEMHISVPSILILTAPGSELDTVDIVRSRRQVLQGLLKTACTTLTLSPYMLLNPDSQDRLEKAILHPFRIDDETLDDLSTITEGYRRLGKNASIDILSGVSGHLTTVVQLLKEPQPTAIYRRLCSLAAESAAILAGILHDLREYQLSWNYFSFAARSAQEANNMGLWGAILGRMALVLIYWGHPRYVQPLLQHAQQADLHDAGLWAWHAAIESEAHAILGDEDAFTRAIDRSKNLTDTYSLGEYTYFTGYDLFRQSGFEGASYVRLHKPDLALQALQRALDHLAPTAIRRHSTLLADIGNVYAQLGDAQQACLCARQALDITLQTKSLHNIQRIYTTRKELALRGNSSEVQELDNQIAKTVAVIIKAKEAV